MTYADMMGFFSEDLVADVPYKLSGSRGSSFHEVGYRVCSSCGMEITCEADHPEFCQCPECGGALVGCS